MSVVSLTPAPGKQNRYTFRAVVTLPEGESQLSVGYGGEKLEMKARYDPMHLNLHLLAVGTNNGLTYAVDDARAFSDAFTNQRGKFYDQVFPKVLAGNSAKALDIAEAVASLASKRYQPNDLVMVYISSHGDIIGDRFKILGSDYKPVFADQTSVDFERNILQPLQGLNCKKLILVDACESSPYLVASKIKDFQVNLASCWNVGNSTPLNGWWSFPYFNRNCEGVLYPRELCGLSLL